MAAIKVRDAIRQHGGNVATFGYPIHRAVTAERRTNPHGVELADYTAACGYATTIAGGMSSRAGLTSARTGELCEKGCWS